MTGKHFLDQIERGLDGVTAGPWAVDGYSTDAVIYMPAGESDVSQWKHLAKCGTADGHWRHNAAHIARCSPDAMREIAAYVSMLEWSNDEHARVADAHAARATAAEATVAALREALEPFAKEADCYDPDDGDSQQTPWGTPLHFKIGDLRRARKALSTVEKEND